MEKELTDLLLTVNDDILLLRTSLKKQAALLREKQRKLLQAHLADAIPLDVLKEEQEKVASELANVEDRLNATDVQYEVIKGNMTKAFDLIENCWEADYSAPDHVRRWYNQAFFDRILVTDEDVTAELAAPIRQLLSEPVTRPSIGFDATGEEIARITKPRPAIFAGRGSETVLMVDPRVSGFRTSFTPESGHRSHSDLGNDGPCRRLESSFCPSSSKE